MHPSQVQNVLAGILREISPGEGHRVVIDSQYAVDRGTWHYVLGVRDQGLGPVSNWYTVEFPTLGSVKQNVEEKVKP
jgi:hypothetical protein